MIRAEDTSGIRNSRDESRRAGADGAFVLVAAVFRGSKHPRWPRVIGLNSYHDLAAALQIRAGRRPTFIRSERLKEGGGRLETASGAQNELAFEAIRALCRNRKCRKSPTARSDGPRNNGCGRKAAPANARQEAGRETIAWRGVAYRWIVRFATAKVAGNTSQDA